MNATERGRHEPVVRISQAILLGVVILVGWSVWDPLQRERSHRAAEYRFDEVEVESAAPVEDRRPALWSKTASAVERMQAAEAWALLGAAAVPEMTRALSHRDPLVRKFSAFALGRIGDEAGPAVPTLTRCLDDDNFRVRENAVFALNRISDDLAWVAPKLVELLADEKSCVRTAAAETLVRIGPAVIPVVCAAAEHPSAAARCEVAFVLRKVGTRDEAAVAVVRKLWGDSDDTVRSEAFRTLVAMDAVTLNDVTAALQENHRSLADSAIQALSRFGDRAQPALPALARLVVGRHRELRRAAIQCVIQLGPVARPLFPDLLEVVKNESGPLRVAAVEALVAVGAETEVVTPILKEMLHDSEASFFAGSLLCELQPLEARGAVPTLVQQLRQNEISVRQRAAAALDGIGRESNAAIPALIGALADADEIVRYHAASALGNNGAESAPAVPALVELLRDEKAYRRNDTIAVVWAVGQIGPDAKAAVPLLIGLFPHQTVNNPVLREEVVVALGKLGVRTKRVLATLLIAISDSSPRTRWSAIWGLTNFRSDSEHLIPLFAGALEDEHPYVRVRAVQALGRLGPQDGQVVAPLVKALDDPNPYVQTAAALELAELGIPARPAALKLRRLLDDEISAVPNWTRSLDDTAGIVMPEFIKELDHRSVEDAALAALERVGTEVADGTRSVPAALANGARSGPDALPADGTRSGPATLGATDKSRGSAASLSGVGIAR